MDDLFHFKILKWKLITQKHDCWMHFANQVKLTFTKKSALIAVKILTIVYWQHKTNTC